MTNGAGTDRVFLLLQGPHGPFFAQLADRLRATGATVWRAGFNRGDQAFWGGRPGYIAVTEGPEDWPRRCAGLMADLRITDLVLYGDIRPVHADAIALAHARGLTVHVFEEGYLRPYWATYERGGSNGHSPLMAIDMAHIRAACPETEARAPEAPARWGDLREHVFYGAAYHFLVWTMNRRYRGFRPHRDLTVAQEFALYLRRMMLMPLHHVQRARRTARVRRGGFPYHLVLLQLDHDASFRAHSPFRSTAEFVRLCLDGFASGAAPHHHLVFKAHPLDDGRGALDRLIADEAARLGLRGRVHFLRGGKLARLLDDAQSAVTVNSTAGQQVLWRGLPLRIFGTAVYDRPGFVSHQPLPDFFACPRRPDSGAYRIYRRFLLETSQVVGGYYAARNRRRLLRRIIDRMLAPADPYTTRLEAARATINAIPEPAPGATPAQHLRLVTGGPAAR